MYVIDKNAPIEYSPREKKIEIFQMVVCNLVVKESEQIFL